jgi:hypothetical protein
MADRSIKAVSDGGAERSPDRHEQVYEALRRRIREGGWKRGRRIPNRLALIREFDTSLATLQKALDRLKADSYVKPRGRAGTFVAPRLPSQYQVGLVFGGDSLEARPSSRMWQALEHEAHRINAAGRWRVRCYYNIRRAGSPERDALIHDIHHDCLAGVFYAATPMRSLAGTELLRKPRLRVMATTGDAEQFGVTAVRLMPYFDKVLDFLRRRGRRRIGLINSSLSPANMPLWQKGLADRGLVFDPYRAVSAYPVESDAARVAVYHMMLQSAAHRPDALLVTDDHMVEPVTQALHDAGVRSPDDVLVVAHCNYPLPPPHRVPVTFIGFDLAEVLDRVVERLAPAPMGGRVGAMNPEPLTFDAKFDTELPAAQRQAHRITPASPPPLTESPQETYVTASAFG